MNICNGTFCLQLYAGYVAILHNKHVLKSMARSVAIVPAQNYSEKINTLISKVLGL